jgi:hypothetical protein
VISFVYGCGASNDIEKVDFIVVLRAGSQGPTGFCRATDAGGIVQIRNYTNPGIIDRHVPNLSYRLM